MGDKVIGRDRSTVWSALRVVILGGAVGSAGLFGLGATAGASAPSGFTPGTVSVDSLTNGSAAAPWNASQGDSAGTAYPSSDLFPTFTPGGPTVSGYPNVSVYPAASATNTSTPYASGVVGTPGPLDDYCGSGSDTTEGAHAPSAGAVSRQPAGSALPFSPYYFPHVTKANGTYTGYFDYRPKDTDEALVAATSSDGTNWTYQGEALEQNPGLCPTADVNDDGEGHANLLTIGGSSLLYTLPRAAGDMAGVGMIVHEMGTTVTSTSPLGNLPATEMTGVDPDDFASTQASVPTTGGAGQTITFSQPVGTGPEALVPGEFIDLTQNGTTLQSGSSSAFGASTVINCTAVGASSLSGCTTPAPSGITVHPGDLIEQVIGTLQATNASANNCGTKATTLTIPVGPNNNKGSGGNGCVGVAFANQATASIVNGDAPDRLYIDGTAVYCNQSNASPTTEIEDCTTGGGGSSIAPAAGDPLTSDPIIPPAQAGDAPVAQTSGLVAPDGIVGVLPTYPSSAGADIPAGATYVMYTEKVLNYFIAGVDDSGAVPLNSTSFTFYPSASTAAVLPASGPFAVYMGDLTQASASPAQDVIVPVTCQGWQTDGTASNGQPQDELTGCTDPASIAGTNYQPGDSTDSKEWIGAPGAATVNGFTLNETGEGSTSSAQKLFKNNEDYSVLRVAYTTDGVNFSSAGLANGGIVSDGVSPSGTNFDGTAASSASQGNGGYSGLNDPFGPASPANLNQYGAPDTYDSLEMRWIGSAGTIVPDIDGNGTIGLFLSGAWAGDGDSDAFNQTFFATSTDGENWTVPTSVVSTDYTFSASYAQQKEASPAPLDVSAYYSGRAYGPSVVANGDGTYALVFAGYRLPKGVGAIGNTVGTNASAQYTVQSADPNLYRNILSAQLTPDSSATTALPESPVTLALPVAAVGVIGGGYLLAARRRKRQVEA